MSLNSCRKKLEVFKTSLFSLIDKKAWHAGAPFKPRLHAQELMLDRSAVRDWVDDASTLDAEVQTGLWSDIRIPGDLNIFHL